VAKEKKYNIVYNIKNKLNGKVYRGIHSTNNLNDGYIGSGKLLIRSINKYGLENFERTILFDYSTRKEASDKERELVTENFCNSNMTYNIQTGGQNEYIVSDDTRKKLSIAQMGKSHTEETKRKMSQNHCNQTGKNNPMYGKYGKDNPNYGSHRFEETKKKMRNSHFDCRGKNHPMYGKRGKDNPNYGSHRSEETKKKISQAKKARI